MFGWNWLFGAESSPKQLPDLPHDYDYYSWWNPWDWNSAYDKDLNDYNRRKKEEAINKTNFQLVLFSLIAILGIYVIKK